MTCRYSLSLSDEEVEIVDKARTNVRVIGKKKWRKWAWHESQKMEDRLRLLQAMQMKNYTINYRCLQEANHVTRLQSKLDQSSLLS